MQALNRNLTWATIINIIIMIYKLRYGWHKDVLFFSNVSMINAFISEIVFWNLKSRGSWPLQRSTTVHIPKRHYFTDEGVDHQNVWNEQ